MSDPVDIMSSLNEDFSSIKTGLPLLAEGLYELELTKLEAKPNKRGDGQNLNFEFRTTQPAKDVEGGDVNPNVPVFDLISMVKTEKYDPRPRVAEFMEAAKGAKTGAFMPLEQWLGAKVMCRIKVERSEEYGNKNRVGRYVKKS